ncbi:SRPBCC family protein [Actinopolymorpha rutila]|uniref:Putative membrane protein n=1 Tax=Actinopolymorpha rutila TaxID=446787 RepID=A0A852ZFR3_9ACTN|nr:putative membrane protein [Actinopolymorpha rutila]
MASKKSSLLGDVGKALLKSPAVERLTDEAKEYAAARGSELVESVSGKLGSLTKGLEEQAENPSAMMTGVQALLEGKSPLRAGMSALGQGLKNKIKGLFGGGRSGPKLINIIEDIEIGAPVSVVYDQWSQFQEFGSFMKGVEGVDAKDEVESNWRGKVWWSKRSWSARVTEQIPDRKIAWTTEGAKGTTKGVVTFHPLADDLTMLLLVMEYYPKGLFEKTANIWRAFGRRVRLDLKHFRRFVTIQGEASGSWRGEIRDGEVVREPDEDDDYRREDEFGRQDRRPDDQDGSEDDDLDDLDDEESEDDDADEPRDDEDDEDEDGFDDELDDDEPEDDRDADDEYDDEYGDEDDEPDDEYGDEDDEPDDEADDTSAGNGNGRGPSPRRRRRRRAEAVR